MVNHGWEVETLNIMTLRHSISQLFTLSQQLYRPVGLEKFQLQNMTNLSALELCPCNLSVCFFTHIRLIRFKV
jgi:hypothetical protein